MMSFHIGCIVFVATIMLQLIYEIQLIQDCRCKSLSAGVNIQTEMCDNFLLHMHNVRLVDVL